MAHVGEEAGLQLVGAPEVVRLFIQFGIERHHAAIGILQLPIHARQFRPAGAPRSPRARAISSWFWCCSSWKGSCGRSCTRAEAKLGEIRRAEDAGAFRQQFLQPDGVPLPGAESI